MVYDAECLRELVIFMFLESDELLPKDRVDYFRRRARRRNKRSRLLVRKQKLNRLFEETKNSYGVGVYYDKWKGRIVEDSLNKSSVRRECNRRFRRRVNHGRYSVVANGGAYRKHEEYWWSII